MGIKSKIIENGIVTEIYDSGHVVKYPDCPKKEKPETITIKEIMDKLLELETAIEEIRGVVKP